MNPPDNRVDNIELFAKSNKKMKKSPKNLESISSEFRKQKQVENIKEITITPVYPRLINASPIIPVFACCKGEFK